MYTINATGFGGGQSTARQSAPSLHRESTDSLIYLELGLGTVFSADVILHLGIIVDTGEAVSD